jgi:uncharacterized RDD family membrane protein YckC
MNPVTENILTEFEETPSVYGTFKERVFALLIDGLILLPLAAIDWFNKYNWKSLVLLIIVFTVSIAYKVFFEYQFGATIGKKSMKLKVVNSAFRRVNLKEVLFRNIFDIAWRIFFFVITVIIYRSAEFNSINSNNEYVKFSNKLINVNPYLVMYSLLIVIEITFILTDKKRRALHDRLGDTLVIKTSNSSNVMTE